MTMTIIINKSNNKPKKMEDGFLFMDNMYCKNTNKTNFFLSFFFSLIRHSTKQTSCGVFIQIPITMWEEWNKLQSSGSQKCNVMAPKQIFTKAFTPSRGNYFRRYATEKKWNLPTCLLLGSLNVARSSTAFMCSYCCSVFSLPAFFSWYKYQDTSLSLRWMHVQDTLELALMRK